MNWNGMGVNLHYGMDWYIGWKGGRIYTMGWIDLLNAGGGKSTLSDESLKEWRRVWLCGGVVIRSWYVRDLHVVVLSVCWSFVCRSAVFIVVQVITLTRDPPDSQWYSSFFLSIVGSSHRVFPRFRCLVFDQVAGIYLKCKVVRMFTIFQIQCFLPDPHVQADPSASKQKQTNQNH